MKKLIPLVALFLTFSCGVQKSIKSDPYVGSYEMTVFEVDNIGDLSLLLNLTKEGENYTASISPKEGMQDVEFEVGDTTLQDNVFTIEAYAAGYDIYFDITIQEDTVSGSLMGMFDLEGTRIKQ
ncbi:hypothetical protein N9C47_00505 [Flavobacteriaceae bacterium]|jgi:hypothetical protein|nr:hypothetical protein [Flavobacteriaceae bacterium]